MVESQIWREIIIVIAFFSFSRKVGLKESVGQLMHDGIICIHIT